MAPPKKTVRQYEEEAERVGKCLIHPSQGAARKVYQMRHGKKLPSHIAVCHTCDTPKCILDKHHFEGTWLDNVRDAVKKGRHSCFANCAKPGKAHPFYGRHHSEATKEKIGAASKVMWRTKLPEEKAAIYAKISAAQKGVPRKKHTEETKAKMRFAHARRSKNA